MRCPECKLSLPFSKAPDIKKCSMCGNELVPTVRDILKDGMFGIITEQRESQLAMGEDLFKAFNSKDPICYLAQGGTGIGKTYAYIISALLTGKRIVISTATKALQKQLVEKDIPYILQKMGIKTKSYGSYKGKGNYACWKLIEEVPKEQRERYQTFIGLAKENKQPADLSDWGEDEPAWWKQVSLDNCPLEKNVNTIGIAVHRLSLGIF